MSIVLYGMSPDYPDDNFPTNYGPFEAPSVAPETDSEVHARIELRIAWLKAQISMHDTWVQELEILEGRAVIFNPNPDGSV